jgi:hypothetical protein
MVFSASGFRSIVRRVPLLAIAGIDRCLTVTDFHADFIASL